MNLLACLSNMLITPYEIFYPGYIFWLNTNIFTLIPPQKGLENVLQNICKCFFLSMIYSDTTKQTDSTWFSAKVSNNKNIDSSSQEKCTTISTDTSALRYQRLHETEIDRKEGKTGYKIKAVSFGNLHRSKDKPGIKVTKVEIKIVKMFISITLLFCITYTPFICMTFSLFDTFYVTYFCFVNHFGNAFIYFYLDTSFRQEVIRMISRLKCC